MERKHFNENTCTNRYFDKNGAEILAGMTLRHCGGDVKKVYECGDEFGNGNLGFSASNPNFLKLHPDWPTEYYPLSQFNLTEWEIVKENIA